MKGWPTRIKWTIPALALAILVFGLVPYPQAFTTAMRQAENHRAAGAYGAAVEAYRRAAELDAGSPQPWLRMGEALLLQNSFAPAASAFLEAERLGGGPEVALGLGQSYAGRGDWAKAMHHWLRALALDPNDARIHLALAQGGIAQGQFGQARDQLAHALELNPSARVTAAVHALLGRLLIGDEPEQAASHFQQAGDQDMLAVLETVNAEASPARRALLLGIAALQRNEPTLARHHFARAVDLDPADAEAMAYLAHSLDRLGETITARHLLERALDLDGDSALVHYFLGLHHRLVGDVEAAQEALWQALLRDPENAAFRTAMADAFVDQPDYIRAEEWFKAAVEVAPQEIDFHLMLVHFYLDHLYRVEEGGLPAAQALAELAPGDARAQDLLGWAYHLTGRPVEAEQALLQALNLDPELASAHYHLGSVYLTTGRRDLARQHLQRVADLGTVGTYRARAEALLAELQ